jgi:hypothetical protein
MSTKHDNDKNQPSNQYAGDKPWRRPLLMKRLYVDEELSGEEIADELGCAPSTVYYWLEKHDIERRGAVDRRVPYVRLEMNNFGHMVWQQSKSANFKSRAFPVHRLLAIAEHGTDAVAGNHVHHKNGIPWDNRPENIAVLTPSEHQSIHGKDNAIPDEELLDELRTAATLLGRPPRTRDVRAYCDYSLGPYMRAFGGLKNAIEAAGIDPETGDVTAEGWDISPDDVNYPSETPQSDRGTESGQESVETDADASNIVPDDFDLDHARSQTSTTPDEARPACPKCNRTNVDVLTQTSDADYRCDHCKHHFSKEDLDQ